MPTLRTVEAWPSTRHANRPWHADHDLAAFLGASRGVFDLYSDELSAARQLAKSSSIRFMLVEETKTAGGFDVAVLRRPLEGFDMARLTVPEGFAELQPDVRVQAALDVVHTTVCALGALRGWERARLDEVHARTVERGLRYSWTSAWKASPGRRQQARAVYWLDADGHGHVQLEVKPHGDVARVTARSEPALAFMTAEGFRRSAATLRWTGAATVTVVPWVGLFGDDRGHPHLHLHLSSGRLAQLELPPPLPAAGRRMAVTTHVVTGDEWMDEPDAEWIALEEMVEGAYGREMLRAVRVLAQDDDLTAWWAATPFRLLRVRSVELDPSWPEYAPKPRSRRSGQDLVLTIVATCGDLASGPKSSARADLDSALLVLAAARRLPPPPPLPDHPRMGARDSREKKSTD